MNSNRPSEPPEEPYNRSEPATLSPASPKPIHFPAPTTIPLLELQMDVDHNQVEKHMADPAMHNTEVRPDFWRDPNEQQQEQEQQQQQQKQPQGKASESKQPQQNIPSYGYPQMPGMAPPGMAPPGMTRQSLPPGLVPPGMIPQQGYVRGGPPPGLVPPGMKPRSAPPGMTPQDDSFFSGLLKK